MLYGVVDDDDNNNMEKRKGFAYGTFLFVCIIAPV